ncbi:WhiB family transcriptional regulator [Streptomyces sp. NPDC005918]|uniref:WhiB family transcriptional regulator n=1 Tax=Streptomyces sp. NPDC005918 TaxID=3155454 RepID=UPI0033EE3E0A
MNRVDWTKAACKDEDPDLFFGEYSTTTPGKAAAAKAKAICAACPIRQGCLDAALAEERGLGWKSRRGIRGGLTGKQRHQRSRRLGIVRQRTT